MVAEVERREVGAALATHRPPAVQSVTIQVAPAGTDDPTTLTRILHTVLLEVVACWPNGTIWVVTLGRGYLQGWKEPATMLLEFGPEEYLSNVDWDCARALGWIDPRSIPADHADFETRTVWADNPVCEVAWIEGLPAIAGFLSKTAADLLHAQPSTELKIEIWFNEPDGVDEPGTHEHAPLPVDVVG